MSVRVSLLLVLVLVLIGGGILLTNALDSKEPRTRDQPWLYRVDIEDLDHISVLYQGEEMGYASKGGDEWVIDDGNDTPTFLDKWAGMTLLLSGPSSSFEVAPEIDDPAKYGLDSPRMEVEILVKNGQIINVHLGDPTPDGDHWYARLVGSDRLFTVASLWGDTVSRLVTEPPYPPVEEASDEDEPTAPTEDELPGPG